MPHGEWVSHNSVLHSVDLQYSIGGVSVVRCRNVQKWTCILQYCIHTIFVLYTYSTYIAIIETFAPGRFAVFPSPK